MVHERLTFNWKNLNFQYIKCFQNTLCFNDSSPKNLVNELKTIQINFLWNSETPKIKHSTLIADYSEGRLKSVDIESKLKAMKLTWVKRLSDNNDHPWKEILSYSMENLYSIKIFQVMCLLI